MRYKLNTMINKKINKIKNKKSQINRQIIRVEMNRFNTTKINNPIPMNRFKLKTKIKIRPLAHPTHFLK